MGAIPSREEAWELLNEFNKDEFHLKHARIVESAMRYFAKELGYMEQEADRSDRCRSYHETFQKHHGS